MLLLASSPPRCCPMPGQLSENDKLLQERWRCWRNFFSVSAFLGLYFCMPSVQSNLRYLSCFCHVTIMHSGGIPEHKRYSIAWRRRRQRSHGWRNNCHFLVTKIFISVMCRVTVLLQSFLPASFMSHLLCHEGLEHNRLLSKPFL